MVITIQGSEGSMGRRYQSILKYLGKEFICVDLCKNYKYEIGEAIKKSTHLILATPTDSHIEDIMKAHYINPNLRILCEKPITKDVHLMESIKDMDITMQYQYSELVDSESSGYSYFNFYNHGKDGLVWDCLQIIALANQDFDLYEDSPMWECAINGHQLNISDMDMAYVTYTSKWLAGYKSNFNELLRIHRKVAAHAESH